MKGKKIAAAALASVLALGLTACGDRGGGSSTGDITVASGFARYDIGERSGKSEGFGAQFDTLIVEAQNSLTDEEWAIQAKAVKDMNLQSVRIRFFPENYERGNDNDDPYNFDYTSPDVDFDSLEMQHLYKLLDLFEEEDVKVDLSWYGCRTTFASEDGLVKGSWLGGNYGDPGVNSWSVVPRLGKEPYEEFAESVAACLNYLLTVKKYTCIYEYSLFPEPDGMMGDIAPLISVAESVERRLEEYGIRDKIYFSGPADYSNNAKKYDERFLSRIKLDKATSSVYPFDETYGNDVMLDFAMRYAEVCNKYGLTWRIAESGTNRGITPVTNADSDKYERAIFMARFMINMVNGGCTGIKYFVFSDCYYDGSLNELGLFRFREDGFKAKPVWYSWSLITRYTDFGSDIFPVTTSYDGNEDPDICITAFRLPDGSWSYFAANSNPTASKKVAVVNTRGDRPAKLGLHRLTGASVPEDGKLTIIEKSGEVDASAGVAYFTVPANGLVVLSDKN